MAFGLQANRLRLKLAPLRRLDLESYSAAQACSLEKLSAHYHVRCKSYLNTMDESQRDDVRMMRASHARLSGAAPYSGESAATPWPHLTQARAARFRTRRAADRPATTTAALRCGDA